MSGMAGFEHIMFDTGDGGISQDDAAARIDNEEDELRELEREEAAVAHQREQDSSRGDGETPEPPDEPDDEPDDEQDEPDDSEEPEEPEDELGGKPAAKPEGELDTLRQQRDALISRVNELIGKPDGEEQQEDEKKPDIEAAEAAEAAMKDNLAYEMPRFEVNDDMLDMFGVPEENKGKFENFLNDLQTHTATHAVKATLRTVTPLVMRVSSTMMTNMRRVESFFSEYPEERDKPNGNIVGLAANLAMADAMKNGVTNEADVLKLMKKHYDDALGLANKIEQKVGKRHDTRSKKDKRAAGPGTRQTSRPKRRGPDRRSETQRAMEEVRDADMNGVEVSPGDPFSHVFRVKKQ